MRKSTVGLAIIGLLTTTALFGMARPAAASSRDASVAAYRCPSGTFCFYEHRAGRGKRFVLRTRDSTFHNNPCAGCESSKHPSSNDTWGDMASSYYNNSGETYCLYAHTGFDGLMLRINHRQRGTFGLEHNDELSSARPC